MCNRTEKMKHTGIEVIIVRLTIGRQLTEIWSSGYTGQFRKNPHKITMATIRKCFKISKILRKTGEINDIRIKHGRI